MLFSPVLIRALCMLSLAICAATAPAEVGLPAVISDHMVVQAERDAAIWGWADAGETVTVWSDTVKAPVAVRYGWAANPIGNLVNAAGWPASPFRTDAWE